MFCKLWHCRDHISINQFHGEQKTILKSYYKRKDNWPGNLKELITNTHKNFYNITYWTWSQRILLYSKFRTLRHRGTDISRNSDICNIKYATFSLFKLIYYMWTCSNWYSNCSPYIVSDSSNIEVISKWKFQQLMNMKRLIMRSLCAPMRVPIY